MRNRTYGGVRGRKTKVGRKLLRFPPTRFLSCCFIGRLRSHERCMKHLPDENLPERKKNVKAFSLKRLDENKMISDVAFI